MLDLLLFFALKVRSKKSLRIIIGLFLTEFSLIYIISFHALGKDVALSLITKNRSYLGLAIAVLILAYLVVIIFTIQIFLIILAKYKKESKPTDSEKIKLEHEKYDIKETIRQLQAFGPDNLEKTKGRKVFTIKLNFSNKSTLHNIETTKIAINKDTGKVGIRIILRKLIPFKAVLLKQTNIIDPYKKREFPLLENIFEVKYFSRELYSIIQRYEKGKLLNMLLRLGAQAEFITFYRNYFEIITFSPTIIPQVLLFVNELSDKVGAKIAKWDYEQEIRCYNCNDIFDPLEENCDKCGAPRPRCVVCLLDLQFGEKDNVVRLPCCGVYAHKDHIITWLKNNPTCPVCHRPLSKFLTELLIY